MKTERCFMDTNQFLRFLTNDIPEQAGRVEKLLQRAASGEVLLETNSLVIAEIIWTLESYYHVPPQEVMRLILAVLNTAGLQVIDAELVLQAVTWHTQKSVDFIDAYNAAWMKAHGINKIFTFDQKHFKRFEELEVSLP
jgi:uncharacterized protein